jgi:protein unc-45
MPLDDSLTLQAEECKQRGNDAFKNGKIQDAVAAYSQGIVVCDRITPTPAALKAVLLSNRAMCSLKVLVLQPCIDDCTIALQLVTDANLRLKLLYRRAKARFLLSNVNKDIGKASDSSMLQDAAKDLLDLLQSDPKNAEANLLLQTVRAQHKSRETSVTPVSKTLDSIASGTDVPHQIKILLGLIDNDTANASMELGRLQAIPSLLQVAASGHADAKTGILAVQCISRAGSHPLFVQRYLKNYQADLLSVIQSNPQNTDLIVSVLSVVVRCLLHADRDDPGQDISGSTVLDYTIIVQACNEALKGHSQDRLVIRAVLDVLSTWTCGPDRDTQIRASLQGITDPTLPVPKTASEIRNFTPHELADFRKRQSDSKTRDLAWAFDRATTFCRTGMPTLLRAAVECEDHGIRREITVVVGRILAAVDAEDDDNDKIKKVVQPFLVDEVEKENGLTIEEVHNDDEEERKQAEAEIVTLEKKMERALITAALLLSKKDVGAWALSTGWTTSVDDVPDLITSENPRAMCLASEVMSGAAAVEAARPTVASLISSGLMEKLMMSDDRDIRSGAASAVAKLGLSDKSADEGERMGLLQAACDLLEDKAEVAPTAKEDSRKMHNFSSFAGSSVERAIEMIDYLVANTEIKEELAAGFGTPGAAHSALERLVAITDLPNSGESVSGYGLATIFHLMAVTNLELRKESFEGKEVTMEAYDEMQKMGKTEEEKDLLETQKDTDTLAACNVSTSHSKQLQK